ncbi:CHAT domain-containing protein [Desulfonema magnum]|uniref:Tetratricopeptide repeat- and CHAT domain-containing n=1 Tax=Desulfonema magnum TaxID=45655 RepID=A0A975BGC5_9BACT|nr:CHAT domain-containing protein [Desulfonema magnum]QTA84783.1 Tetratricopeptide repeat- and CHAT domain-containing [Desulfonema magnum]
MEEDNEKVETRNSKLETRNLKLETRNSELETRNSKLETRNSKLETRNSKSGTRNSESGTRNPELGTRNPKLETRNSEPENVLHLDVTRVADRLKIIAYEQLTGEAGTVRHYEEIPIPIDTINTRCREIAETLNKANRQGCVSRDILTKLREIGQVFFDDLFTYTVKEKLRKSAAEHLMLNLDDTLVHIPWELLHDGKQFLCLRFSMGRLVRTRQNVPGSGKSRELGNPLKMLILADPGGDLNGAYAEGTQLRDYIDQNQYIVNASLRTDSITRDYVREKIRSFDFVHYAGHSDYDQENPGESGWRLSSGTLSAQEIMKMAGTGVMPSLIFSNACQSARTEGWNIKEHFHDEIFGLANAFVLSGVKHYVGTFWEILDEPSRRFALEFYQELLSGRSAGAAVRHAREMLIKEYGEETIVWASYLLYGDPAFNYIDRISATLHEENNAISHESDLHASPGTKIRAQEDFIDFSENRGKKRNRPGKMLLGAGIILFLILALWGYPGILKKNTLEYEQAVLAAYNAGNFETALSLCQTLEQTNSQVRLAYVIRGDIYLRQGKLDAAQTEYRQAIQASEGTKQEKARAFIGLGRVASVRKETNTALTYYRQATEANPKSESGYMSRALLMNDTGDDKERLKLLVKARELSPDNRLITSVIKDIRKKILLSQDHEKQERINVMVKELLENMASSPPEIPPSDTWTSVPLTLWMPDFKTQGYATQEGQDRLIAAGIANALIEQSRIQLVERALLDKLLEELKLGTSELTDRNTALSLGKLLAARLMLSGQIICSGPQTQICLRVIETETGLISAAITETFGGSVPPSVLADTLSENLLDKLKKRYPLRGMISEIKGNEIILNIGSKTGVAIGQRFRVINNEAMMEVVSMEGDRSVAKVIKGKKVLTERQRIEIF